MFDAIVHLARMSFTHEWLKPADPIRPASDRDTGTCNPDNERAGNNTSAQTEAPQRIWFGGCCG